MAVKTRLISLLDVPESELSREYWYWRHLSFSFWKMVWDAFLVQDVSRWSPVPGRSIIMMLTRVTVIRNDIFCRIRGIGTLSCSSRKRDL